MPRNPPKHPVQPFSPDQGLPSGEILFYGRFSLADNENNTSIAQQLRACREAAAKDGHEIPDDCAFADHAVRGSVEDRPGLNRLFDLLRSRAIKCTDLYIFDTSRLARDEELAMKFQKFFNFYKVRVHYVANGMVSGTAGFDLQHVIFSGLDAQYSKTLGQNVRRGQIDQLERGYAAMARTYGYKHVDDIDPAHADSFDRRNRKGVLAVLDPEQSEVVRLIFRLYLAGKGYDAIARYLNENGIRSPRRPTKSRLRLWSTTSVRTILTNERYIGNIHYGKLATVRDPETRKIVHQKRPEGDYRKFHFEELRIVSDAEFEAVRKLRASRDTLGAQRKSGGLAKGKGTYIWSGLLKCGRCGGPINVCQPDTYMCSTYYRRGGCTNETKLNRLALERDLTEYLVRMVREARSFDSMVDAVVNEAKRQQAEAEKAREAGIEGRENLQARLQKLRQEVDNLTSAVATLGLSDALSNGLRDREAQAKLLRQQLDSLEQKPGVWFTRAEVADFLSDGLAELANILLSDPQTCRDEIRDRVDHLILSPTIFEGQPSLEITGDLRLFNEEKIKMLGCNGPITAKHLALSLSGLVLKLESNGKILRVALLNENHGCFGLQSLAPAAEVSAAKSAPLAPAPWVQGFQQGHSEWFGHSALHGGSSV